MNLVKIISLVLSPFFFILGIFATKQKIETMKYLNIHDPLEYITALEFGAYLACLVLLLSAFAAWLAEDC
tara:strand:+ start:3076 stop:3285 length:210 start_codon:yes stop_codon:yes gene_type:complete